MNQKYILITGASRGIGRAIALEFAKNGHPLILISSKSPDALKETRNLVSSYNVDCLTFTLDVTDYTALEQLKATLREQRIFTECIINNAGISYFGLIQNMSIKQWHSIINTNLSSAFYLTKLFISDMLHEQSGCIINISSVFGNTGASCEAAYSASKGGLNAFTKSLAKELAPSKIRVNAIACGAIDTAMNSRLTAEEKAELENEIPAGRMGTVTEVAKLACQIYEMNEYLTGQIITIDGGWT